MSKVTLATILSPPSQERGSLRWDVTVPLASNPFLFLEWLQFSVCGASIVLITLVTGSWLTENGLYVADVVNALRISLLVLAALVASFIALSLLFFRNRYFATYQFDTDGLYYEGIRGTDKRSQLLSLAVRPYPVIGGITASTTRSRHIPWEKMTSYQNMPAMRVIVLRRGFWHMAKVYTPDDATHRKAVALISAYLNGKEL